ncbi:hypothetical protein BJI48_02465 [Helicobacter sp. 11S02596-1]|nr:hypothetical protein BJI48_02465 [Helicobacter sp. 11S02596-1]
MEWLFFKLANLFYKDGKRQNSNDKNFHFGRLVVKSHPCPDCKILKNKESTKKKPDTLGIGLFYYKFPTSENLEITILDNGCIDYNKFSKDILFEFEKVWELFLTPLFAKSAGWAGLISPSNSSGGRVKTP